MQALFFSLLFFFKMRVAPCTHLPNFIIYESTWKNVFGSFFVLFLLLPSLAAVPKKKNEF